MDASEWQGRVGRKWAEEWRRTDRSFAGLTDRLLGFASSGGFRRALDVGCGAGELSLALARGHPAAEVVGVDVSRESVEAAAERGARLANVRFELADAATWDSKGFAPDRLVSRHGVMFFDRPEAAFAHLREVAAPDARLVFSCFRDRQENGWASEVARLLPEAGDDAPDTNAPGPFAFADPARVEAILGKAGWRDVTFSKVDWAYVAGSGDNPVADALSYFLAIGPAARGAAQLAQDEREDFVGRLRRFLEANRSGSIVALPAAAWIVTARSGGA
ncbi:MAG: class I SAM-dependent methyltransferase [Tsuneonella sp.]